MPVKVIKPTIVKISKKDPRKKVRVAAYCRVSTDQKDQETSYEAQVRHYISLIQGNTDYEFAGIYADEGISGTSTRRRDEFLRMIRDCESHKIDMILTKSISRFARNTIDTLTYIRKLKSLGIAVFFEKENIDTLDAKGEVLLTIMASIAQQESQSISENVKIGVRYRMQQGSHQMNTGNLLGYTKDENGNILIVPDEAVTIRRIYRRYLEGCSQKDIADELSSERIPTPLGKNVWYSAVIGSILTNEKYCGDYLMQKYYVEDYLSHRMKKNTGQYPQYFVEGNHDPIIPKEVFTQTQGEICRRKAIPVNPSRKRYAKTDPFHAKLICGTCGRTLKKYVRQDEILWRCLHQSYIKKGHGKEKPSLCGCPDVERPGEVVVRAFVHLQENIDRLTDLKEKIEKEQIPDSNAVRMHYCTTERYSEKAAAGYCDSGEHIDRKDEEEIAEKNGETETLALDKMNSETRPVHLHAELADKEFRLRLLLEAIQSQKEKHCVIRIDDTFGLKGNDAETETLTETVSWRNDSSLLPSSCSDYEDFMERTAYSLPDSVTDETGRIISYHSDLITRFIEDITVFKGYYIVRFKAGPCVKVDA